jgi:hypothetical protein
MGIKLCLAAVGIISLLGCAPLHLYPVHGPLADQRSVSVIKGKATGLLSGRISFVLPDGEACQGPWSSVSPNQVQQNALAANASAAGDMPSTWNAVFGSGYYVANVLGARQYGQAVLNGDRGTIIQLEFYRNTVKDSPLLGIAKDNKGNIYKLSL